jgi:hypothetical protein
MLRGNLLQMSVNGSNIRRVDERVKTAADKFVRAVTQTGLESGICELQGTVCPENGDDFPGGVQQVRKLCGPESDSGVRDNSLGHVIVASLAGGHAQLPAGLSEASKDRPRTRKCQLKIKCLPLTLTKPPNFVYLTRNMSFESMTVRKDRSAWLAECRGG